MNKKLLIIIGAVFLLTTIVIFWQFNMPKQNTRLNNNNGNTETSNKNSMNTESNKQTEVNNSRIDNSISPEPKITPKIATEVSKVRLIDKNTENEFGVLQTTSPDGHYKAETIHKSEQGTLTRITDTNGNRITDDFTGSFAAWYPDSKKVALYLPIEATGKDREIFYLDIEGNYYKSDLPSGIISLDISNAGDIVYALTDSQTDYADLYVKRSDGNTRLILKEDKKVLTHIGLSPAGDKVAFLESHNGETWIYVINLDGSNFIKIHKAKNIPFVWAYDSSKITFIDDDYVYEYKIQ